MRVGQGLERLKYAILLPTAQAELNFSFCVSQTACPFFIRMLVLNVLIVIMLFLAQGTALRETSNL